MTLRNGSVATPFVTEAVLLAGVAALAARVAPFGATVGDATVLFAGASRGPDFGVHAASANVAPRYETPNWLRIRPAAAAEF